MRPLKLKERQFLARVRKYRNQGYTWAEIATKEHKPESTVFQQYHRLELREIKLSQLMPV